MSIVRIGFFSMTLAVLATSVAAASPSDQARTYHERARAAFALGRYPQAAEAFERAFELKPDAALLYNAAQAHRLAGNKERALSIYQNYLRVYGHVGAWAEVEARIEELKRALAEEHAATTAPPPAVEPGKGATSPRHAVEPAHATEPPPTVVPPAAEPQPEPPVLVDKPPGEAPDEGRPLTSRPLFWVGLGVGVAAIATVVVVVVLNGRTKDPMPSLGGFTAGN